MSKKIINVVYDVNDKELIQAKKVIQDTEKETKKAESTFKKMGQTGSQAFGLIGGIAATLGLAALGKQIFSITAEFQKLAAVLTNTLGSRSLALAALNDIKTFAAQTPFSVVQLTDSFVKLANQGFKPTLEQMRKLGDLASAQGKGFDQLTEALIDGQTGEFERLKEFGIRASKEGDKVTFTFKGVQTQVKFTNEAIREYILSLGDLEGVSGSMAAISETLGGQVSNLGDSFDSLFNGLGQASTGILSFVLGQLSQAVQWAAMVINSANQLSDPFAGSRADSVKAAVDAFDKMTDTQKIQAINDMAQEVQMWRQELELLEKAFAVNEETGLSAQEKLEKASKILGLSVEDTIEIFKKQNFELALTKSNVKETEEIFKLYTKAYQDANKETTKELSVLAKLQMELKRLQDARQAAFSEGEILQLDYAIQKVEKSIKRLLNPTDALAGTKKMFKMLGDYMKVVDEDEKKRERENNERSNANADREYKYRQEKLREAKEEEWRILEEAANKRLELERRVNELTTELVTSAVEFAVMQREVDTESISNYYDEQLSLAGNNDKAKEQLEIERDRKLQAAERRNKQIQKENARSKILIDTAVAVIKTFAQFGYPAGIVPAGLMTGISLIAMANVKKYKDGGWIEGPGTPTSDSVPIMASRDEFMVNAKAASNSRNLLEAINDRRIDDRILNVAANGGSQVNVFDDSRIIAELQKGRVDYEVHGYTLMRSERRGSNFKLLMRAKNQGY